MYKKDKMYEAGQRLCMIPPIYTLFQFYSSPEISDLNYVRFTEIIHILDFTLHLDEIYNFTRTKEHFNISPRELFDDLQYKNLFIFFLLKLGNLETLFILYFL